MSVSIHNVKDIAQYGGLLVSYGAPEWMGKVLQKFERRKHKLISNRDRVQLKVEAIDHKTEKVSDVVFEWLKETEILMQDMENLKTQSRISSLNEYRKLRKRIKALNIKCVFEPFSTPILSLERFSSENNFMCFKSTEKASDEVLEALQDDNCSIIGLNGEAKRARKILSTIENMDRPILVIIDDVRAIFDLERVGIPCHSNRCKVLLTARCKQDCELMNCQRKIQLDPVSTEEACNLFKVYSAIHHEENSELLNVAREVAIECEGLPKNIIKVGTSLRSKPMEEWKASLENLRNPMAQWQMFLSFRGEDTRFSFTVDPSDIRHLRKSYGKAMAHHEKILGVHSEKIRKWKSALLKVSDLSGKPYTTGYEYEFIQKIVEDAKHIENRLQIELEDHRRCQAN
ncbi:hypothetical protein P8452_49439 [Trifolium repens]|nr:hypothetical protein P8452_49439 [Trifolium repens]